MINSDVGSTEVPGVATWQPRYPNSRAGGRAPDLLWLRLDSLMM